MRKYNCTFVYNVNSVSEPIDDVRMRDVYVGAC